MLLISYSFLTQRDGAVVSFLDSIIHSTPRYTCMSWEFICGPSDNYSCLSFFRYQCFLHFTVKGGKVPFKKIIKLKSSTTHCICKLPIGFFRECSCCRFDHSPLFFLWITSKIKFHYRNATWNVIFFFSMHWICNGLYNFHPHRFFFKTLPRKSKCSHQKKLVDKNFPNALSLQASEATQKFILFFSFRLPNQRFRESLHSRQVGWNGKLNALTSFLSLIVLSIFTSAADVRTTLSSSNVTIMVATPFNP